MLLGQVGYVLIELFETLHAKYLSNGITNWNFMLSVPSLSVSII